MTTRTGNRVELSGQVIRFLIAGAGCALVDFGCYWVLLNWGIWVHLAKASSLAVGTTTAFFVNRRFTFRAVNGGPMQAGSFALLYSVTFLVNVGTNALALHSLPALPGRYALAWVIAQATATTINFAVLRAVVFRK